MEKDEFHKWCREQWAGHIIDLVGHGGDHRFVWHAPTDIIRVLAPFMAEKNTNHAMLPTGGGMDLEGVRESWETGCLEFNTSDRSAYVGNVRSLTLEYFEEDPAQSFFIIDPGPMDETGVYEPRDDGPRKREELTEIYGSEYIDRASWDYGEMEDGSPLPVGSRLIVRWLGGRVMFVCKRSIWNGINATYNAHHNRMSNEEIRAFITKAIAKEAEHADA